MVNLLNEYLGFAVGFGLVFGFTMMMDIVAWCICFDLMIRS